MSVDLAALVRDAETMDARALGHRYDMHPATVHSALARVGVKPRPAHTERPATTRVTTTREWLAQLDAAGITYQEPT